MLRCCFASPGFGVEIALPEILDTGWHGQAEAALKPLAGGRQPTRQVFLAETALVDAGTLNQLGDGFVTQRPPLPGQLFKPLRQLRPVLAKVQLSLGVIA